MFERFSSGYYLGRLYVTPGDRATAAMCRRQHERVNEQLYGTDEPAGDESDPTAADAETEPTWSLPVDAVDRPIDEAEVSAETAANDRSGDDPPLVMKLEDRHFAVTGDEGVPRDTLTVPRDLLAETRISNPPTFTEVLLAKGDRVRQLLGLTGVTWDRDDTDDGDGFDRGFGSTAF